MVPEIRIKPRFSNVEIKRHLLCFLLSHWRECNQPDFSNSLSRCILVFIIALIKCGIKHRLVFVASEKEEFTKLEIDPDTLASHDDGGDKKQVRVSPIGVDETFNYAEVFFSSVC